MQLKPGTTLHDTNGNAYRIIAPLGKGGQGYTFQAMDMRNGVRHVGSPN